MRKSDLYGNAIQTGLKDDSFGMGYKSKADDLRSTADNDAKLTQLLKGQQNEHDLKQADRDAGLKAILGVRGQLPAGSNVHYGDVSVDTKDPATLGLKLTPGLEAAEKEGGKKAAEFQGGGRASMESNIGQIQGVQNDLEGGKRDRYDRVVGGALENHPTLQAMFNPAEKARRDQVQNAMLGMLHDAGIPRPTQWDIQRVFGQVYDSASDDQTNIARVKSAVAKMAAQKAAREQEAQNLQNTGYVTPGLGGNPRQGAPISAPQQAPQGGTGLEHLSDEQLQQMAKQLGL